MIIVLVIYVIASLFLFVYSLTQGHLLWKYIRKQKSGKSKDVHFSFDETLPKVTIQLPLFNEQYVTEKLIDKICEIEYPLEAIEIQVLDDSTDDTTRIAQQKVKEWKAKGRNIVL